MMNTKLHGVVYTTFDEIIGPQVNSFLPRDLSGDAREKISFETYNLNVLKDDTSESLAVIPYNNYGVIAIIKYFRFKDESRRGNGSDNTLIILVDDRDAMQVYKNMKEFIALTNASAANLRLLQEKHAGQTHINKEVASFFHQIENLINNSQSSNLTCKFPPSDYCMAM